MAKRRTKAGAQQGLEDAPLMPTGALAVALLAFAEGPGPVVHVARDARRLEDLAATLRALEPDARVAVYPEWDCLPFDHASPSRATMGARAAVMRWLTDRNALPDFVLTTAPALVQRVPPPETWASARVTLRVGDPLDVAAATEIILEPGSGQSFEPFTGQEHRLDRYYPRLVTLLDYVPEARLAVEDGTQARIDAFFEQMDEARGRLKTRDAPAQPGDGLYLTPEAWRAVVAAHGRLTATEAAGEPRAMPRFAGERRPGTAFAKVLRARLKAGDVVVLAGSVRPLRRLVRQAGKIAERPIRLIDAWADVAEAAPGDVLALEAPLAAGFRVPEQGASVIAAADLFGPEAAVTGGARAILPMGEVDLRPGDVAVDRDHGLCVFEGLEPVSAPSAAPSAPPSAAPGATQGGAPSEALRLRFAGDAILMVPVTQADRIWRYGSEPDAVTLDKLDGGTWPRRRLEAEATMARTARLMLEAARARRETEAPVLAPPASEMERFAAGFGFAPTPDQAAAVDALMADLASGRPMDRLVCGDVGFGKTEVALRALAAAIFSGRQAALIAPTTVLARQHAETLRRRFGRFGVEVAQLSRLVAPAEAKRVKAGLADGTIRLVVGTHALAGGGVAFADLGLTVIDEEQRFGAKMKADLRRLADGGHVLTLTATPIPRTLQAALVGLQSLSVLATPPALRQPVRTVVAPFDAEAVREALIREHRRGGQSFVVCPRIEDIAPMAERLRALVPGLDILVAHGDLKPSAMDEVMVRFAEGDGDVLLATAIVESGLDVPRANTMLVWEAARFGLAQLHQLRGRVGRGQRRGTVHLLSDPAAPTPAAALQRLRALEALDRLGAGFAVSARDLDLRGAGDLVGEDQAGHAKLVGLGLYQHLLQLALTAAKGERAEDWSPEIELGLPSRIPEDYVPEPEIRLSLYTRLLRLQDAEAIEALAGEVEDRFGAAPAPVLALFDLARLRAACCALGVARLRGGPQGVAADLRPDRPLTAMAAEAGIVLRDGRVVWKRPCPDSAACTALATDLLERIRAVRESAA